MNTLDGDKLLAELQRKIGLLWKQIDYDVGDNCFDTVSNKHASIKNYERVIALIKTGHYTIEGKDYKDEIAELKASLRQQNRGSTMNTLDGDKLLAELQRKIGLLWKQIDYDVGDNCFDTVSNKHASIRNYERVIALIKTGHYTIEGKDYRAEIAELKASLPQVGANAIMEAVSACQWVPDSVNVICDVDDLLQHALNLINNSKSDTIEPLDELGFLDDIPEGADDYEVEMYDGQDDGGCEGGACKL
jgi:predicted metal-binding protein